MAYRDRDVKDRIGNCDYRIIEIEMTLKGTFVVREKRCITVDSHRETLSYVEEHLVEFVTAITRLRRLQIRT